MTSYVAAAITDAVQNRTCIRIWYEPGERLVEPHTFGRGADGQLLLRAYQVSGASASWRNRTSVPASTTRCSAIELKRDGAATRNRTPDILLTRQALCRLSYDSILRELVGAGRFELPFS